MKHSDTAPEAVALLQGVVEGTPEFQAVTYVLGALPADIRSHVVRATASTPDNVVLTLNNAQGTQILWGGTEDSAMKALVLQKFMAARPPDTVAQYDVSSPSAVVIR